MDLDKRIYKLTKQLKQNATGSTSKYIFATAESCTGGMVASAITSMPGSSQYFDRGFVTYSNDAKKDMLGVLAETLNTDGAVSKNVAKQMALGVTRNSHANIAVSITGIAGPSGGSAEKPVGTVFIAISLPNSYKDISKEAFQNSQELVSDYVIIDTDSLMKTYVANFLFTGDRGQIRKKSCIAALELMLAAF